MNKYNITKAEEKALLDKMTKSLEEEYKTEVKFAGYGWDNRDNTAFATFLVSGTGRISVSF